MTSTIISPAPPPPTLAFSPSSRSTSNSRPMNGMQLAHNAANSFDSRPPSAFASPAPQHSPPLYPGSQQGQQQQYFQQGPGNMSQHNSFRQSFGDMNGGSQGYHERPQIYSAVYSGVSVYETEINNVAVMKRRSDSWLNATQILKVAGVDKGKRTKVLEKEILTGEHEKVQGGYGKYQGTWINYNRGRQFCREYGVEDLLRPLLEYDTNADGNGGPGPGIDTPTKEQAMAANRKRMYSTMDGRGNIQSANGTFFSNISSTASNAIAAMNKVARLNSPAPRPGSAQRRPGHHSSHPSLAPMNSQESFRGSQQSMHSERSFQADGHMDTPYGSQGGGYGSQPMGPPDTQEPPRKRMRPSSQQDIPLSLTRGNSDVSMRDGSPTEPADSFMYHPDTQVSQDDDQIKMALAPLPQPVDKLAEEKQNILLDLFADLSRTDFNDHPAIIHLSGSDLDLPLDQSANTAIHWAATLARVPLMRLLIHKGANIYRGNAAGQTALMSAVQVNNCLDHSCFPEVLEILAPLIEMRDIQGRTILHHIAVSCGIKGRGASSKYYLEALLEFLVRNSSANNALEANSSSQSGPLSKPIGLMRFMSEMVNTRDKAGNTALNLVARVGNRSIIQQLLEVQADPSIPNYKGLRPVDFGVGGEAAQAILAASQTQAESPDKGKAPTSKIDETSREILPSLSGFLTQTESSFSTEVRAKQETIDRTSAQIQELSALQKSESQKYDALASAIRARTERRQRLLNLQRGARNQRLARQKAHSNTQPGRVPVTLNVSALDPQVAANGNSDGAQIPRLQALRDRVAAYGKVNATLKQQSVALKARNGQLENGYRKVVSLCTGVPENRVEEMLPMLLAAVESEGGHGVETGRVNDFLRNMQGVEG